MPFECQYLAYLEALMALRDGVENVDGFWPAYRDFLEQWGQVLALSTTILDRKKLVEALQAFKHKYEGPFPRRFLSRSPVERAKPVPTTRSQNEDMGILDMFRTPDEDTP